MGVEDEVLAGTSGSLLDQPKEFIESRNVVEAIVTRYSTLSQLVVPIFRRNPQWKQHPEQVLPTFSPRFCTKATLDLLKVQGPACRRLVMPEEEVASLPGRVWLRLGQFPSETGCVGRGDLADDRS